VIFRGRHVPSDPKAKAEKDEPKALRALPREGEGEKSPSPPGLEKVTSPDFETVGGVGAPPTNETVGGFVETAAPPTIETARPCASDGAL
jgi:hypothetical protein